MKNYAFAVWGRTEHPVHTRFGWSGDLCNLAGATLAGLLPTVIILAVYVSSHHHIFASSTILILLLPSTQFAISHYCGQVYYYRWKDGRPIFTSRYDYGRYPAKKLPLYYPEMPE